MLKSTATMVKLNARFILEVEEVKGFSQLTNELQKLLRQIIRDIIRKKDYLAMKATDLLSDERITAIKQILMHHRGKKNAISSRKITTQLKILDNDTFGHTRSLIMRIIKTDNLPITCFRS